MATHTTTISNVTYEVTESLADDGLPLLCQLVNLAAGGPEIRNLSIVGLLLSALANKELAPTVRACSAEFAKMTQIVSGGKKISLEGVFTTHFQGKYTDLIQWLAFCLKANFGDGFLALFQNLVSKGTTTGSESESPRMPDPVG